MLNISWPLPSHGRYLHHPCTKLAVTDSTLSQISKYRCASQRKTRSKPALFHELVFGQWEIQPCLEDSYTSGRGGQRGNEELRRLALRPSWGGRGCHRNMVWNLQHVACLCVLAKVPDTGSLVSREARAGWTAPDEWFVRWWGKHTEPKSTAQYRHTAEESSGLGLS